MNVKYHSAFIPSLDTRLSETGEWDTIMTSPLETTTFSLESFKSSETALPKGQGKFFYKNYTMSRIHVAVLTCLAVT